jgi:formate dehydrogenase
MPVSELHPTACNLCYANCGILVEASDGHFVKVRGDKNHPASRGYLCNKASRLNYYQHGLKISRNVSKTPIRP